MTSASSTDDSTIGELATLFISSQNTATDKNPITLTDLPDDILQEIGGLLLNGNFSSNVSLRHSGLKRHETYDRDWRRKNVLALASTCKSLRTVLFGRWFLSKLVVQLTEMELSKVEALSPELRECVRYVEISSSRIVSLISFTRLLMIIPGRASPEDTGRSFSFIDFIRLFPNVETLRIRWRFYEEGERHLLDLHAAAANLLDAGQNQTGNDLDSNSKITTLHVETLDSFHKDQRDLDQDHIRQIESLLQQLRFPAMRSLDLDFGCWQGLHFAGSEALWTALFEMFGECQSQVLEEVQIGCRMMMNGRAIGFDLCVSPVRAKRPSECNLTSSSFRKS
jgi:hypothetical protein